jgi:hypothetical protein
MTAHGIGAVTEARVMPNRNRFVTIRNDYTAPPEASAARRIDPY